MGKTRNTYTLAFSVRRLTELLEEAGFSVQPSAQVRGGMIQFVSTPTDDDVFIEWARGMGSPWERITGTEKTDKEVETTVSGAYL